MPIRICCGDIEQLKSDDACLIIVDLGFSGTKETTGVLVRGDQEPKDYEFGAAMKEVAIAVKKAAEENKAVNMVLEAPLSYRFVEGDKSNEGNPAFRDGEQSEGKRRGWYYGAGATTALAAMFFLRKMISKLDEDIENGNLNENKNICIYLYEGLVSFKSKSTDHIKDCEVLMKAIEEIIRNNPYGKIGGGGKMSILEMLNLCIDVDVDCKGAPLIIFADAPS